MPQPMIDPTLPLEDPSQIELGFDHVFSASNSHSSCSGQKILQNSITPSAEMVTADLSIQGKFSEPSQSRAPVHTHSDNEPPSEA